MMGNASSRWLAIVVLGAAAMLLALSPAERHLRAVRFLERLSSVPATSAAAPAPGVSVAREELTIPGKTGSIRARIYFPQSRQATSGVVVVHGVHYRGIDERRLVSFARALAETGQLVLTPELSDIADYQITERGVATIRDSVAYLSNRRDLVASGRVGLIGFSFAGGLSLVAARDPVTAGHLSYVTSVGGHHDLREVMRFLVHDEIRTPAGIVKTKAHEYGLVVLVYENLDEFVPAMEVATMREAFKAWLHEDRPAARRAAQARTTPEGERLWRLLESQRLQELAPELDAILEAQRARLVTLSAVGHLRELSMPVYLLHGSNDSVIPPSETNAADLELAGTEHQALVSPLLEHVEVSKTAGLSDKWALISFMAKLM